jgi:hypothetical protein
MPTHREQYPEQYTHAHVGRYAVVTARPGTRHRILRVMPTRWGLLAELDGLYNADGGNMAYRLYDLTVETEES